MWKQTKIPVHVRVSSPSGYGTSWTPSKNAIDPTPTYCLRIVVDDGDGRSPGIFRLWRKTKRSNSVPVYPARRVPVVFVKSPNVDANTEPRQRRANGGRVIGVADTVSPRRVLSEHETVFSPSSPGENYSTLLRTRVCVHSGRAYGTWTLRPTGIPSKLIVKHICYACNTRDREWDEWSNYVYRPVSLNTNRGEFASRPTVERVYRFRDRTPDGDVVFERNFLWRLRPVPFLCFFQSSRSSSARFG